MMYHTIKRNVSFWLILALLLALFAYASVPQETHAQAAWAPNVSYSLNTLVTYGGSTYKCITAHTSQTGWEPGPSTAALWELQSGGGSATNTPTRTRTNTPTGSNPTATPTSSGGSCNYPNWVAGTNYVTGNIVKYNNAYYIAEHDNPGYDPTVSTWFWDPYTCSGGGGGGSCTLTAGIMTESQFNSWFSSRHAHYTWANFCSAANTHYNDGFLNTGTTEVKKRELAAFLANISHETSFLVYIEEIVQTHDYCDNSQSYGCPAGEYAYFGRGAIQLSWNFNYKAAGDYLGTNLLQTPSQVSGNNAFPFRTAIWYWMTQNGPGPVTAHVAITNATYGFGYTIKAINGALECNGGNPAQVQSRIDKYSATANTNFVTRLGTTAGNNLYC